MVLLRAASNKAVATKGGNGERLLRLLLAGIGSWPLHHDDKLRDCEEGRMYGCTHHSKLGDQRSCRSVDVVDWSDPVLERFFGRFLHRVLVKVLRRRGRLLESYGEQ